MMIYLEGRGWIKEKIPTHDWIDEVTPTQTGFNLKELLISHHPQLIEHSKLMLSNVLLPVTSTNIHKFPRSS